MIVSIILELGLSPDLMIMIMIMKMESQIKFSGDSQSFDYYERILFIGGLNTERFTLVWLSMTFKVLMGHWMIWLSTNIDQFILAQVMPSCLTARSHSLQQSWISEIPGDYTVANIVENKISITNMHLKIENYTFMISGTSQCQLSRVAQFALLVLNYGISNTIVLEIP